MKRWVRNATWWGGGVLLLGIMTAGYIVPICINVIQPVVLTEEPVTIPPNGVEIRPRRLLWGVRGLCELRFEFPQECYREESYASFPSGFWVTFEDGKVVKFDAVARSRSGRQYTPLYLQAGVRPLHYKQIELHFDIPEDERIETLRVTATPETVCTRIVWDHARDYSSLL